MQKASFKAAGAVIFWLIVWELISLLVNKPLLLPSPLDACRALGHLAVSSAFYSDAGATFMRCLVGILLSSAFGVLTAVISHINDAFRAVISLPVNFLKAVPVMAVIIYGLILLTSGNVPILACFLMCYPIVHTNILAGLDYLDSSLLEMSRIYEFSGKMKIRNIYIPSLLPQIKSSLSLMAGLSWKSVIAAEVLSVPASSMGYRLLEAKIYIETDVLFAWVISIVALSLIFEKIIKAGVAMLDVKSYDGSKLYAASSRHTAETANKKSPAAAPSLSLENIHKSYGEKTVIDNLSADFRAGEITALMAPSGKGKTTLLRLIAGLEKPDSGRIIADDGCRVSYLFQEDRLLPWLNVFDNLATALKSTDLTAEEASALIFDMSERLEISESLYKLPSELSGGMKHRVAIGRALLREANLLLLDEPFRGLDEELKSRLTQNLKPYLAGRTVLLVTHDSEDAKAFASSTLTI